MQFARQNVLVGAFVLVGLAALGALAILFGSGLTRLLGGDGYPIIIEFGSVRGIRPGNPITLAGLEIGQVEEVKFAGPAQLATLGGPVVEVHAIISKEFENRIPKNSTAIATEPAFGQGRPPIEITPGDPKTGMLAAGDRILNAQTKGAIESLLPQDIRFTFEKATQQVGDAAEALTPVLTDMHDLLARRSPSEVDRIGGPQGNLASAVARIDAAAKHLKEVLGDPAVKSQIRETIANAHKMSEDGKVFTANLRASSEKVDEVVERVQTVAAKAETTVDHLDSEVTALARDARGFLERATRLADTANEMAAAIQQGEGTLGRLLHDSKLYESMVLTFQRVAQAMEEFRLMVVDWRDKGKIRVAF
jgi:phospholipid/cholesterol/gamma-HCH transport system substrate-binding protein